MVIDMLDADRSRETPPKKNIAVAVREALSLAKARASDSVRNKNSPPGTAEAVDKMRSGFGSLLTRLAELKDASKHSDPVIEVNVLPENYRSELVINEKYFPGQALILLSGPEDGLPGVAAKGFVLQELGLATRGGAEGLREFMEGHWSGNYDTFTDWVAVKEVPGLEVQVRADGVTDRNQASRRDNTSNTLWLKIPRSTSV